MATTDQDARFSHYHEGGQACPAAGCMFGHDLATLIADARRRRDQAELDRYAAQERGDEQLAASIRAVRERWARELSSLCLRQARECEGGMEAHGEHLAMNGECPWCGASRG